MTDLEFFRTDVKSYDSLDTEIKELTDKIKPLNVRLKELKSKKSELQGNICEFMAKNDIDTCNLKSGRLVYKESKAVKPVTQTDVKESIIKFFTQDIDEAFDEANASEKAQALIEFIYERNRESSTKSTLRRAKGSD
jgi:predicted transcriptional regulator